MLLGKLYGNLRLNLRSIPADILKSDDLQCASECFESKRLPFLRISSKNFVFSGSSVFSCFEK